MSNIKNAVSPKDKSHKQSRFTRAKRTDGGRMEDVPRGGTETERRKEDGSDLVEARQ